MFNSEFYKKMAILLLSLCTVFTLFIGCSGDDDDDDDVTKTNTLTVNVYYDNANLKDQTLENATMYVNVFTEDQLKAENPAAVTLSKTAALSENAVTSDDPVTFTFEDLKGSSYYFYTWVDLGTAGEIDGDDPFEAYNNLTLATMGGLDAATWEGASEVTFTENAATVSVDLDKMASSPAEPKLTVVVTYDNTTASLMLPPATEGESPTSQTFKDAKMYVNVFSEEEMYVADPTADVAITDNAVLSADAGSETFVFNGLSHETNYYFYAWVDIDGLGTMNDNDAIEFNGDVAFADVRWNGTSYLGSYSTPVTFGADELEVTANVELDKLYQAAGVEKTLTVNVTFENTVEMPIEADQQLRVFGFRDDMLYGAVWKSDPYVITADDLTGSKEKTVTLTVWGPNVHFVTFIDKLTGDPPVAGGSPSSDEIGEYYDGFIIEETDSYVGGTRVEFTDNAATIPVTLSRILGEVIPNDLTINVSYDSASDGLGGGTKTLTDAMMYVNIFTQDNLYQADPTTPVSADPDNFPIFSKSVQLGGESGTETFTFEDIPDNDSNDIYFYVWIDVDGDDFIDTADDPFKVYSGKVYQSLTVTAGVSWTGATVFNGWTLNAAEIDFNLNTTFTSPPPVSLTVNYEFPAEGVETGDMVYIRTFSDEAFTTETGELYGVELAATTGVQTIVKDDIDSELNGSNVYFYMFIDADGNGEPNDDEYCEYYNGLNYADMSAGNKTGTAVAITDYKATIGAKYGSMWFGQFNLDSKYNDPSTLVLTVTIDYDGVVTGRNLSCHIYPVGTYTAAPHTYQYIVPDETTGTITFKFFNDTLTLDQVWVKVFTISAWGQPLDAQDFAELYDDVSGSEFVGGATPVTVDIPHTETLTVDLDEVASDFE